MAALTAAGLSVAAVEGAIDEAVDKIVADQATVATSAVATPGLEAQPVQPAATE